ncbi:MAG: PilZ domain-containing protein [Bacteriovoracaceae bacterium]|nr:PilZ domain-containing protein [Bacteriovoracaceae bacterium]
MTDGKRSHVRRPCSFSMRIYSSLKGGAYSVAVTDISEAGAFIKTSHLPQHGETISFELIDQGFKPVYMGSAVVRRLKNKVSRPEAGFGIQFDRKIDSGLLDNIAN